MIKFLRDLLYSIIGIAILTIIAVVIFRSGDSSGSAKSKGFARSGSEIAIQQDVFGCQSTATLERARDLFSEKDTRAALSFINTRPDGECRYFVKGNHVIVEERALLSGIVLVHLKGDFAAYWIPNIAVDSGFDPAVAKRIILLNTPGCQTMEQLGKAQAEIVRLGVEAGMREFIPQCWVFSKNEDVVVIGRSGSDVQIRSPYWESDKTFWIPKEAVDPGDNH
jgi:hypothetical protein